MDIVALFGWIQEAAEGGLDVISAIANGLSGLFFTTADAGTGYQVTFLGALTIASVGAPLAWKFIKYIVSLFKKVQPN